MFMVHSHKSIKPQWRRFPPELGPALPFPPFHPSPPLHISTPFYQRVSIASYASAGIAVCPSVCPSVTLRYCIKTKKATVMISSPIILVSGNIWFITKFDRDHPERGRFLRLGWVRTGDFGDFSTNKPPYLRNGAR